MRTTLILSALLVLTTLGGCENTPETSDKDVEPISYTKLIEIMSEASESKPVVIVDVRTLANFEKGHIPGAINIFLPDLRKITSNDPRLADADRIIVYANGFSDSLSPIAAKDLLARGFSNVYDFRGGWDKWEREKDGTPPGGGN